MQSFLKSKVAAGYALVFLLCPLDPSIPSLNVPVGILPTNLKYTTQDIGRYESQILNGLNRSGFRNVVALGMRLVTALGSRFSMVLMQYCL